MLRSLLSELHRPRLAYVVTHRNADIDAYCSAYAVARLLKTLKVSGVRVVLPGGIGNAAESVYGKFPMPIDEEPDFAKADMITVVDTNNPLMLSDAMEGILESSAPKILIDHHPPTRTTKRLAGARTQFIDTGATSACEVVYRLYKENKIRIGRSVAQVLLIGIMADSQHLFLATERTIEAVNDLCSSGASLNGARRLLIRERDLSERIARLKAAQRTTLYSAGNFIVAFSRVGSFNASSAKALVDLGADLAVVISSSNKSGSRASMRATQEFHARSKLHLGTDVCAKLSESGGGHPTAAALTIDVGEDRLEEMLVSTLEAKLGKLNMIRK